MWNNDFVVRSLIDNLNYNIPIWIDRESKTQWNTRNTQSWQTNNVQPSPTSTTNAIMVPSLHRPIKLQVTTPITPWSPGHQNHKQQPPQHYNVDNTNYNCRFKDIHDYHMDYWDNLSQNKENLRNLSDFSFLIWLILFMYVCIMLMFLFCTLYFCLYFVVFLFIL